MSEITDVRPAVGERTSSRHERTGADIRSAGVVLDLAALAPEHHAAWIAFIRFALRMSGDNRRLQVFGSSLASVADGDILFATGRAPLPRADERFAFLSDARCLSRKLLRAFDRIHLVPRAALRHIDTGLYLELIARGERVEGLEPAALRVSLISSVFDGDRHLAGFLANMAALAGYERCEHFLIRPASPGAEHAALMAHVCAHPGAVYINLERDPGLYGVWNLGARLATARYLSNANLDDRRHPRHVQVLADVLDGDPELAVASSALRVTEDPELRWDESDGCPVMFGRDGDLRYGVEALVQGREEESRARNLPHCMPVWRRTLHGRYGWFDETRWGPSADWEFWLRVARGGECFRLLGEALGLYLRHPQSYWRRGGAGEECDARILASHRVGGMIESQARRFDGMLQMLRMGGSMEALEMLHGEGAAAVEHGSSAEQLCRHIQAHFLGVTGEAAEDPCVHWHRNSAESLFMRAIALAHRVQAVDGPDGQRIRAFWNALAADILETADDRRAILLYAFILRRLGDREGELRLLRALHAEDHVAFWTSLQSVYRHEAPLAELSAALAGIESERSAERSGCADLAVTVFPAYRGNTYQSLLYRGAVSAGAVVREAKTLEELAQLQPVPGRRNVFHLHWINAIFRDVDAGTMASRADEFLLLLQTLRARGFEIRWTVHNRLSHECVDPVLEADFRRRLCALADRIYVHHPLAAELLEWLPERSRLMLAEHGPYDVRPDCPEREAARRALGFAEDDFVLACIGQLRSYKGLAETLPPLIAMLDEEPRLRLLIAGRLRDERLRDMLAGIPASRLMLREERLADDELETCIRAADCGLLSYREILTSGALVHWATLGRPVLAPAIGTIPAYVVHGWNGLLYRNCDELKSNLRRMLDAPAEILAALGDNARRMARTLSWKFS